MVIVAVWHGSLAEIRESIVPMPWMEEAALVPVAIAIAVVAAAHPARAGLFCAHHRKSATRKGSSQAVGIDNLKILSVPSMPVHFTCATHPQPAAIVVLSELVLKC